MAELEYACVSEAHPARVGSSNLPVPTLKSSTYRHERAIAFARAGDLKRFSHIESARWETCTEPVRFKSPRAHKILSGANIFCGYEHANCFACEGDLNTGECCERRATSRWWLDKFLRREKFSRSQISPCPLVKHY